MEVLISPAPGAASVIKMDRDTEVARGLDAALLDRLCLLCVVWCHCLTLAHSPLAYTRPHTPAVHAHTHTHTQNGALEECAQGTCPRCWPYAGLAWYAGHATQWPVLGGLATPHTARRAGAGSEVDGTSSLSRPGAQVHACQVSSMPMHWAITLARRRKPRPPPPVSDSPPLHRATRVAVETRRRCQ